MPDETPASIMAHSCLMIIVTVALVVALLTLATATVPLHDLADRQRIEAQR